MKSFVLLVALVAVAAAEIDWSKVRPIEEFDHYWARLPAEMQAFRYTFPNRRITNGEEATPGQFPYQVALISNFPGGSGLCGASVLTNNYILTAAHCVQGASGGTAIIGAHNRLNNEPSQQSISFDVSGINMHEGYNPNTIRNDVATVRLNIPIVFNDRVQPVRMTSHSDGRTFAGMMGVVSGFGRTSDASQATSPVVRFTSNPIMTNADCLASWGGNTDIIGAQNICLSGVGGRSSCNGDSGGPLTVTHGGATLQVGLVSFGSAAGCSIGMPSVYARLTYFLRWIEDNSDFVAPEI